MNVGIVFLCVIFMYLSILSLFSFLKLNNEHFSLLTFLSCIKRNIFKREKKKKLMSTYYIIKTQDRFIFNIAWCAHIIPKRKIRKEDIALVHVFWNSHIVKQ